MLCSQIAVAERLVEVVGSQSEPVQGVSFSGVVFEHSRSTFLGGAFPRFQASGSGDWSLYPSAALYLEGTENITVSDCTLQEMGGNGLMMHGYNRFNRVVQNEMHGAGDSGIVLIGKPRGGIASADVTDGNFPSDNLIHKNHIHETGVLTKQSSPVFSGISCHNVITDNVSAFEAAV